MSASNQPQMENLLQQTLLQLQKAARGEIVEIKNYQQIEQAVQTASAHQLPLLQAVVEAATAASFATVDGLLARKGKSPHEFLQELSSAGTISLSSILSAGAKLREFQTDLPDLTRGAAAFLIARSARIRIEQLAASDFSSAELPNR